MKILIELDENLSENEVLIRCGNLDEEVKQIQNVLKEIADRSYRFSFFKDETEYYIPVENILFFETDEKGVCAHTKDDMFTTKHKLYELLELLPRNFIRVSKSTIINVKKIYSISKNLTSVSEVQFVDSHKQVYVSRRYYKILKDALDVQRR